MTADLKTRYGNLFPDDAGCTAADIRAIESGLSLRLPADFADIAAFCSGGSLGDVEFFSFTADCQPDIVGETLRLRRSSGLPHHFIFLAEFAESAVFLDTRTSEVSWILSVEFDTFIRDPAAVADLENRPDFAAFFAYCLAEEEQNGS